MSFGIFEFLVFFEIFQLSFIHLKNGPWGSSAAELQPNFSGWTSA